MDDVAAALCFGYFTEEDCYADCNEWIKQNMATHHKLYSFLYIYAYLNLAILQSPSLIQKMKYSKTTDVDFYFLSFSRTSMFRKTFIHFSTGLLIAECSFEKD